MQGESFFLIHFGVHTHFSLFSFCCFSSVSLIRFTHSSVWLRFCSRFASYPTLLIRFHFIHLLQTFISTHILDFHELKHVLASQWQGQNARSNDRYTRGPSHLAFPISPSLTQERGGQKEGTISTLLMLHATSHCGRPSSTSQDTKPDISARAYGQIQGTEASQLILSRPKKRAITCGYRWLDSVCPLYCEPTPSAVDLVWDGVIVFYESSWESSWE